MQELLSFVADRDINPLLVIYEDDPYIYEYKPTLVAQNCTDFIIHTLTNDKIKVSFPEPLQSAFGSDLFIIGLAKSMKLYLCDATRSIFYTLRNNERKEVNVKLIIEEEGTIVFVTEDDLIYVTTAELPQHYELLLTLPTEENEVSFQTLDGITSAIKCSLVQNSPSLGVVTAIYNCHSKLLVLNERNQLWLNGNTYDIEYSTLCLHSMLVFKEVKRFLDGKVIMLDGRVVETPYGIYFLTPEELERVKHTKCTFVATCVDIFGQKGLWYEGGDTTDKI